MVVSVLVNMECVSEERIVELLGSARTRAHQLQLRLATSLASRTDAMAGIGDDYFAEISRQDGCLSLTVHDCKYNTDHAHFTIKESPPTNMVRTELWGIFLLHSL